jgi:hypothetical protein
MNFDVASPLEQALSTRPSLLTEAGKGGRNARWKRPAAKALPGLHTNPEIHAFERSLPTVNKKLPGRRLGGRRLGGFAGFCSPQAGHPQAGRLWLRGF